MIKWFCDVCGLEIEAPQMPVRVAAYRSRKCRDDIDIGWGESDDIGKVWCHDKCADALEAKMKPLLAKREASRPAGETK